MCTVRLNKEVNMHIKLLSTHHSDKPNSKLLGYAIVQVSDRYKIIMNVFRSDKGHTFLKFPTTKIGEEYRPNIEFINMGMERDITAVVGEEVANFFKSHTSAPTQSNFDSEIPF